jgi:hypothetical protein
MEMNCYMMNMMAIYCYVTMTMTMMVMIGFTTTTSLDSVIQNKLKLKTRKACMDINKKYDGILFHELGFPTGFTL